MPRRDPTSAGVVAAPVTGTSDAARHADSFDEALRAAVRARGLSLERLRARLADRGLRVGVTTLSYWQRGVRRPERPESLRAVAALEEILGLPSYSLTTLLGPPRPRGAAAAHARDLRRYAATMYAPDALTSLLPELDDAVGKLQLDCQIHTVYIGRNRNVVRGEVLQVVRALQDVDRTVAIVWSDGAAGVHDSELRATRSCRVGRTRRDREAGVLVGELLFDRRLRAGDTHVLGYEHVDVGAAECREFVYGFRFPIGQHVSVVRFHPDALPVRCRRFVAHRATGPERAAAELTLDAHHSVYLSITGPKPGVAGIRWDWC